MSTGSKHRNPWYRQSIYWIGWTAGGMVSVLASAVASTFIDREPYRWTVNIGYAVASLPLIGYFIWSSITMKRRMQKIEADFARHRDEEDKHER